MIPDAGLFFCFMAAFGGFPGQGIFKVGIPGEVASFCDLAYFSQKGTVQSHIIILGIVFPGINAQGLGLGKIVFFQSYLKQIGSFFLRMKGGEQEIFFVKKISGRNGEIFTGRGAA